METQQGMVADSSSPQRNDIGLLPEDPPNLLPPEDPPNLLPPEDPPNLLLPEDPPNLLPPEEDLPDILPEDLPNIPIPQLDIQSMQLPSVEHVTSPSCFKGPSVIQRQSEESIEAPHPLALIQRLSLLVTRREALCTPMTSRTSNGSLTLEKIPPFDRNSTNGAIGSNQTAAAISPWKKVGLMIGRNLTILPVGIMAVILTIFGLLALTYQVG